MADDDADRILAWGRRYNRNRAVVRAAIQDLIKKSKKYPEAHRLAQDALACFDKSNTQDALPWIAAAYLALFEATWPKGRSGKATPAKVQAWIAQFRAQNPAFLAKQVDAAAAAYFGLSERRIRDLKRS